MGTRPFIPERLEKLEKIELLAGGHLPPAQDPDEPEGCAQEIYAWLRGLEWTDRPERVDEVSPVIAAVLRRLNDRLPVDLRQQVKPYLVRQHGTADGADELRGWIATNWSIRTGVPIWFERAGATDAAELLREMPEVTPDTVAGIRTQLDDLRREMRDRRQTATQQLNDRFREELERRGLDDAEAEAAAEAAAHAVAAADGDAAGDAFAAAYAATAAVSAAGAAAGLAVGSVGAAGTNAASAAVAATIADAVGGVADEISGAASRASSDADRYLAGWDAVYPAVRPRLVEAYRPYCEALLPSALEMLDRLIDPKAVVS